MRSLAFSFFVLVNAAAAGGCAPTARSSGASLFAPRQTIVVELHAQEKSQGHKLFLQVFDLLLAESTESPVVISTDSLAVPTTLGERPLSLSVEGLTFEIAAGQDRLALGSVVEGRQFLLARASYVTAGGADQARSGQAVGRASLTSTGVRLQTYFEALTSLAEAIVRDAMVP